MDDELRGRVHRWRASLQQVAPHNNDEGLIAGLYFAISGLYKEILPLLGQKLGLSTVTYRKIERGYSSLILWSHSHGVSCGKLDTALERCRDLRQITLRLLVNICTAVLDRLIPHAGLKRDTPVPPAQADARSTVARALAALPETDSHGDQQTPENRISGGEQETFHKITSNIRTLVQTLADLGPLFEEPIADEEGRHEEPAQVDISTPVANLVSLIKYMFPKCDETTARGIGHAVLSTWYEIQEKATAAAATEQQADQVEVACEPAREAMTLIETLFHDSGVGTSIATKSSYAETVRSYHTNSDRPINIRLPPLPKPGRVGEPFRCEACRCTVRPGNERAWKRHLMKDARPYMCIEAECAEKFSPFADKEEWISHISGHYSKRSGEQLRCPICTASYTMLGNDISSIATHLAHHLEPIAAELVIPGVTFTGPDEGDETPGTLENASGRNAGSSISPPNDASAGGLDDESHGAYPEKKAPPSENRILTPDDLREQLLQMDEPERCFNWLECLFEEDPYSSITQVAIWQAYQLAFAMALQQLGRPMINAAEFIKNIPRVFQNAEAQIVRKMGESGEVQKYVISGIRPRRHPIKWPGKQANGADRKSVV